MTPEQSKPEDDRRFMAEAIRVSRTHTGLTDTNPSVGCVIVKDGEIVGCAVTAVGGRPHAETQAIAIAGDKTRGATAYVTLEPCAHWGRTPPCANALVEAGVARVVVAVTDPDPRVAGQGLKILTDAGITVDTGLMEEEGKRALAGYLMRQTNGRPYVTLKLAVSADGMLGRRGEEIAITGEAVRSQVHHLRAESDAILVGIGTVLSDDPELTVRIPGLEHRSPLRIVLDRGGRFPEMSRLALTAEQVPVIVAAVGAEGGPPPSALPGLSHSRGEIEDAVGHSVSCRCGQGDHDELSPVGVGIDYLQAPTLESLLKTLGSRGISTLLVEGGAATAKTFLDENLVDRIVLYESDKVIGEGGLESPLTPSDIPEKYILVGSALVGPDRRFEFERSA